MHHPVAGARRLPAGQTAEMAEHVERDVALHAPSQFPAGDPAPEAGLAGRRQPGLHMLVWRSPEQAAPDKPGEEVRGRRADAGDKRPKSRGRDGRPQGELERSGRGP